MSALRGFARMSPEKRAEVARKGGQTAHATGRARRWEEGSEAAREAGRKGGRASKRRKEATDGGV